MPSARCGRRLHHGDRELWSRHEPDSVARRASPCSRRRASSLRRDAQPIKLGELNSYKVFPAFLEPYKKGMELAHGRDQRRGRRARPASSRSSRATTTATPGDAVRVAEELLSREKVAMLMGTFASNVGLAVADLAKQRKVLFLASEPLTDKIVWDNGNKYTFRLRASTYMQTAMLVPEAAKLGKKRWAIVYPNYEYGQSATAAFKQQMMRAAVGRPRVRRAGGAARQDRRRARSCRR